MRPVLLASAVCLLALPATARDDREQVAAMLIERGYSCVASLHRDGDIWRGTGFDHGATVRFAVDAGTGRLLSETPHVAADY